MGCLALAGLVSRALVLALAFAAMAVMFAAEGIRALRKDPYDLQELRRVHEQAEVEDCPESAFCPFCSEVYDSDLKVCPNCRRSPF